MMVLADDGRQYTDGYGETAETDTAYAIAVRDCQEAEGFGRKEEG